MKRWSKEFDLGVILDHKHRFKDHISTKPNKARSLLAFIKRWSKEFDDPYTIKVLYVSLVSIDGYGILLVYIVTSNC